MQCFNDFLLKHLGKLVGDLAMICHSVNYKMQIVPGVN